MTLRELVDSGIKTISSDEAAKIVGIHPQTLRNALLNGTCPFGFPASRPHASKQNFVVSVVKLVNWMTDSHYFDLDEISKAR